MNSGKFLNFSHNRFTATVLIVLFQCSVLFAQTWTQFDKLDASDRQAYDELGTSVAISGNYAIVGAPSEDHDASGGNPRSNAGSAYIYERNTTGQWVELRKIVAFDRDTNDRLGFAVSISGDNAVVSAIWQDKDSLGNPDVTNAGALYVYHRNTMGQWNFVQKLVAPDRVAGDYFGASVAIDGNYIVAGTYFQCFDAAAQNCQTAAGAAYIFERDTLNGSWGFVQKIVGADRMMYDYFGHSVAIDSDQLVVGAVLANTDSSGQNPVTYAGAAYVFQRQSNGQWMQTDKITALDRSSGVQFGQSVAISGNTILVGANLDSLDVNGMNPLPYSGSAYIFEKTVTGGWTQTQKITQPDRTTWDIFGYVVSISGDTLISSAPYNSTSANYGNPIASSGSVYTFVRNSSGIWTLTQKVTSADRGYAENFGISAQVSGNRLIVGAFGDSEDENVMFPLASAGSAFIFQDTSVLTAIPQNEPNVISVFPNPGHGLITIDCIQKSEGILFDAVGREVARISLLPGTNAMDLTGFASGNYVLRIESENWVASVPLIFLPE